MVDYTTLTTSKIAAVNTAAATNNVLHNSSGCNLKATGNQYMTTANTNTSFQRCPQLSFASSALVSHGQEDNRHLTSNAANIY